MNWRQRISALSGDMVKVGVVVPILNPGAGWEHWLFAIRGQGIPLGQILVLDSGNSDGAAEAASGLGIPVHVLYKGSFDHGGTRQLGVSLLHDADIIVFLTQDSLPICNSAISRLVKIFADSDVGAAYGRQLPRIGAKPIEAHARLFNYPEQSRFKQLTDVKDLGIKTAFISNSFAAYRREALMAVGGFPSGTIFGEDTIVAARMLLQGWKLAYCADAQVYHSHHYTYRQEFRRYFDIGVLHAREPWIQENFGGAAGEGKRFVISELKYLLRKAPWLIPSALLRSVLKLVGYRLGRLEARLPLWLKKRLSMNRRFWEREPAHG